MNLFDFAGIDIPATTPATESNDLPLFASAYVREHNEKMGKVEAAPVAPARVLLDSLGDEWAGHLSTKLHDGKTLRHFVRWGNATVSHFMEVADQATSAAIGNRLGDMVCYVPLPTYEEVIAEAQPTPVTEESHPMNVRKYNDEMRRAEAMPVLTIRDLPEGMDILTGDKVAAFFTSLGTPNTYEYSMVFVGNGKAYGTYAARPFASKDVWLITDSLPTQDQPTYDEMYQFLKSHYKHERFEGRNGQAEGEPYSHREAREEYKTLLRMGRGIVSSVESTDGKPLSYTSADVIAETRTAAPVAPESWVEVATVKNTGKETFRTYVRWGNAAVSHFREFGDEMAAGEAATRLKGVLAPALPLPTYAEVYAYLLNHYKSERFEDRNGDWCPDYSYRVAASHWRDLAYYGHDFVSIHEDKAGNGIKYTSADVIAEVRNTQAAPLPVAVAGTPVVVAYSVLGSPDIFPAVVASVEGETVTVTVEYPNESGTHAFTLDVPSGLWVSTCKWFNLELTPTSERLQAARDRVNTIRSGRQANADLAVKCLTGKGVQTEWNIPTCNTSHGGRVGHWYATVVTYKDDSAEILINYDLSQQCKAVHKTALYRQYLPAGTDLLTVARAYAEQLVQDCSY